MGTVAAPRRVSLALGALLLAACSAPLAPPNAADPTETAPSVQAPFPVATVDTPLLIPYTSPPRVTGTQRPACLTRAHGMLPDPACTPGSVGSTDAATICVSGFELRHRPGGAVTAKKAAMAAYHLAPELSGRTEYDHLIPLSLGGANDVTNLWPEVSDLPGGGFRNSKDGVELRVLHWVCSAPLAQRQQRLTDTQAAMARDWTAAEKFLGVG